MKHYIIQRGNNMQNRDIPVVKEVLEKLYNEPGIDANAKLDVLNAISKIKIQEPLFMAQRDAIINKYCEKEKDGKTRKTAIQKIGDKEFPMFVFSDENRVKFNNEMLPLLGQEVLSGLRIRLTAYKIATTNLTAKDLSILNHARLIKLRFNDEGSGIFGRN